MIVKRLKTYAAVLLLAATAAATATTASTAARAEAGASDRVADDGSSVLVFPRLNGTFRDLAPPDIAPVSTAGLTIRLSSPSNSLTVRGHELQLEPLGGPRHRFSGWVVFLGKAELVAEFDSAMAGGIEDQVLLPIQKVSLEGEVDFVKMPGGYDVTIRKLPTHAEIAMQSRLAGQLVTLCDMMTILTGGDCSGLDTAFSRVRLPLPKPGETYFVAEDDLTAEERQVFDDYLAGAQ